MRLFVQDGDTPLTMASLKGCVEIVKLLLDRGAVVNVQTEVSEV